MEFDDTQGYDIISPDEDFSLPPQDDLIFDDPLGQQPGPGVDAADEEKFILGVVDQMNAFFIAQNLAESVKKEVLDEIGFKVVQDFLIDERSCEPLQRSWEMAMDLARLVWEAKYYGGGEVANVKFPMITGAVIQFASRCYSEIIKGKDVVKCAVIGEDPTGEKAARGKRIAEHMSYQLLGPMEDWEEELDQLLTSLPVLGVMFRKTYWDPVEKLPRSELVFPKDLVVNYFAKNIKTAARITHKILLRRNEIVERVRRGAYLDLGDDVMGSPDAQTDDGDSAVEDDDAPHVFLEQHRWWDLDGDGYEEPYVITVHRASEKVVRIIPRFDLDGVERDPETNEVLRIEPTQYFTRFIFMPSMDGSFYGLGFGTLLSSMNNTVNASINQLLDAGTAQNRQSGFIGKGLQIGRSRGMGESIRFHYGEWKHVNIPGDDLRKNIVPLPISPPSQVTFELIRLMIEASEKLAGMTNLLAGESPGPNVPVGTTLALIEQGLKPFSTVFKRVFRSLKSEITKLRRLNRLYLPDQDYYMVLDDPRAIARTDYDDRDMDVLPIADPGMASDLQRTLKAQALFQLIGQGFNDDEIRRRYLESLQIPDVDKLLPDPNNPPPPDPAAVAEIKLKEAQAALAEAQASLASAQSQSEMVEQEVRRRGANTEDDKVKVERDKLTDAAGQFVEWVLLEDRKLAQAKEIADSQIEAQKQAAAQQAKAAKESGSEKSGQSSSKK